jgi:hypothetical protein
VTRLRSGQALEKAAALDGSPAHDASMGIELQARPS